MNGYSDPIAALKAATSLSEGLAAEQERNRPRDRAAVTSWRNGYIAAMTPGRVGSANYPKDGVILTIQGATDIKAATPMAGDTFTIGMTMPGLKQDGTPRKLNPNSELGLFIASARALNPAIDNITDLLHQTVDADEQVHTQKMRKASGEFGPDGKEIWREEPVAVYFYSISRVGGVGAAAAAAAPPVDAATIASVKGYVSTGNVATNAAQRIKDMQDLGVDFNLKENYTLQTATISGTLQEWLEQQAVTV